MINEHDIEDMKPDHMLTSEEVISDDKAYWLNLELEALSIEMGWGRLSPDLNKRFYE